MWMLTIQKETAVEGKHNLSLICQKANSDYDGTLILDDLLRPSHWHA
jgi:hypothetical protein